MKSKIKLEMYLLIATRAMQKTARFGVRNMSNAMVHGAAATKRERVKKSERIELRVNQENRSMFEPAAALTGTSVSSFLAMVARKAAEEIIERDRVVTLTAESYDMIVEMLANPPELNDRMKAAIERSKHGVIEIETKSTARAV